MADDQDSEQNSGAKPDGGAAEPAGGADSGLLIRNQYIKDFSFENPRAPRIFAELTQGPDITVNISVAAARLQDDVFEVVLSVNAKALVEDQTAFLLELDFAGLVSAGRGIVFDNLSSLLLVEIPRYLFPFARSIIAEATRQGGFPPLLINPIDFADVQARRQASVSGLATKETAETA